MRVRGSEAGLRRALELPGDKRGKQSDGAAQLPIICRPIRARQMPVFCSGELSVAF